MSDLREHLRNILASPVCWVGIGNPELGDDGLGVRLAEMLRDAGCEHVVLAGAVPENHLGAIEDSACREVVFLDATDFGGEPGSVAWLETDEIVARHPQVSTHRLSLGVLATMLGRTGVPPVSPALPNLPTARVPSDSAGPSAPEDRRDACPTFAASARRVSLLAVQPERLTAGLGISEAVEETLETLRELLLELGAAGTPTAPDTACTP